MTRLVRLAVMTSAVATVMLTGATASFAGSYEVLSCKAAAGNLNAAWSFVETGPAGQLQHGDSCAGSGEFGGLWVYDNLSAGASNGDVSGYWRFDAPPTTTITGFSYSRYLRTYDDPDWRSEVRRADGATFESCDVPAGTGPYCMRGTSGGVAAAFTADTTRLEVGVRCATGSSSLYCINGASIHKAQATLYGATVTIDDPLAPQAGALTGSLFAGGWVRGTRSAAMTGADATGIQSLELMRDGATNVKASSFSCDYRVPAPCPASASSAWSNVDTTVLSDGTHAFSGVARDAAGNTQAASADVRVDNTAPVAPIGLTADAAWSSQAVGRTVSWSLPGGQVAPIGTAQVTLCRERGSCFTPSASTTGSTFGLPSEGRWVASVRLVDAAGNVGAAGEVPVGYDAGSPSAPALGTVEPAGGNAYRMPVDTTGDPGPAPITSVQGEACPVAGGACSALTGSGAPPTAATFELPGPGDYAISARGIDAAGNVGATASETYTVPSGPTPSATATPSVTAGPSATPTATPATPRIRPMLKVTRAQLTRRRVAVRGVVSKGGTGRVAVRLAARGRAITKSVKVRSGTFVVTVRLDTRLRGIRHARLRVRYGGDARYLARTVKRRLSRSRR